jgi:hypothetical protein
MPLVPPLTGLGTAGPKGDTGYSAYDIALLNGFVGTEEQWLADLQGEQGIQGIQGVPGIQGNPGPSGIDGESAYETAVNNGYTGTEAEWLNSLKATLPAGAVTGDVLTGVTGSEPVWAPPVKEILVLAVGAPVPPSTLSGTIILRRET